MIFTALQYYEYSEAAFTMSDGVYGSAFYASTGLHGLHVIIGIIFITIKVFLILLISTIPTIYCELLIMLQML